jgi:hypothetical protein
MRPKKLLVRWFFIVFPTTFLLLVLLMVSSALAVPNIKANGSDGPITVSTEEALVLTVELVSGPKAGDYADWWLIADAYINGLHYWYHWSYVDKAWLPGIAVAYQGPLPEVAPPYEVLNYRLLPPGTYVFYFAVDTNMNGIIDGPDLYPDSVTVEIEE